MDSTTNKKSRGHIMKNTGALFILPHTLSLIHPGKQPFTIIEGDLNAECGLNADETEGYAWMRIEQKACGNEVMKE